MNYKSFSDLSSDVGRSLHKLPSGFDLVVGIPRSGMIPAYMIGLHRNLPVCDLQALIENRALASGSTRKMGVEHIKHAQDARSILVVDDSIATGKSLESARKMIESAGLSEKVQYAVVYATAESAGLVDYHVEIISIPRFFQWNVMHRREVSRFCFDIDGVLCVDPTSAENDDGVAYNGFLAAARPHCLPSYEVGYLVTSRLEKYREQTEAWLAAHGIRYKHLYMLNLESAEERRKAGAHGKFKAEVYRSLDDAILFIESESSQAIEIARESGKPVLDFGSQVIVRPGFGVRSTEWAIKDKIFRIKRKVKARLAFISSNENR